MRSLPITRFARPGRLDESNVYGTEILNHLRCARKGCHQFGRMPTCQRGPNFKPTRSVSGPESSVTSMPVATTPDQQVVANTVLFADILRRAEVVNSIIEFGANVGMNLHAIHRLLPDAALDAVEINERAADRLRQTDFIQVIEESILEFVPRQTYDLSLIKGVLIHVDPSRLTEVYDRLYESSRRYVCVIEYYNPTPVAVPYRGHTGKLFKRDFAGEMLDRYTDLSLVDYGFVYRRDRFPQDDLTWFLMEKRRGEDRPTGAATPR